MWKPQQLVDRAFSLWHIMSNRKHAMWNKKHATWNTKHLICKHIPYFEKWPNVSWMEPSLRNLSEPNVSWMEPWLRNLSEPNVSWMEPWLRNLSEPNVSWMEPWLRNLSEPNVSWMEPSLRNLSKPNVSWMEPSLRNLSEPNVSWMEPSLRNLSEPNVSWMEPSLRNLSEPNVSWMEPWLRNLSEPNVSWMEPSLRNLSEPNISWMEPSLRNLSKPNVSWMEPSLRNLSEPNVSWMEPSLRNLSEPNVSWMEPSLRNLSEPNVSWMEPWLRNLSEPNVSWMEPSLRNRFHSFGTSRNLVQGFGRLPQTTPKLYWKNPKPFRLLGKKTDVFEVWGAQVSTICGVCASECLKWGVQVSLHPPLRQVWVRFGVALGTLSASPGVLSDAPLEEESCKGDAQEEAKAAKDLLAFRGWKIIENVEDPKATLKVISSEGSDLLTKQEVLNRRWRPVDLKTPFIWKVPSRQKRFGKPHVYLSHMLLDDPSGCPNSWTCISVPKWPFLKHVFQWSAWKQSQNYKSGKKILTKGKSPTPPLPPLPHR